jgi:hypothetical protein
VHPLDDADDLGGGGRPGDQFVAVDVREMLAELLPAGIQGVGLKGFEAGECPRPVFNEVFDFALLFLDV